MGFSLQAFMDELQKILAGDESRDMKLALLNACINDAASYAAQCGMINRPTDGETK